MIKVKTPMLHYFVCFQLHYRRLRLKYFIIRVRNFLFLKNHVTSEVAFSHNVLYNQQLSIARYQVSFILTVILSNYQWLSRTQSKYKCSVVVLTSLLLFDALLATNNQGTNQR